VSLNNLYNDFEEEVYSLVSTIEMGDFDNLDIYFNSLNNIFQKCVFGEERKELDFPSSLREYLSEQNDQCKIDLIKDILAVVSQISRLTEGNSSGEISENAYNETQDLAADFESMALELIEDVVG
tara:strand:+ start:152365 stop:152739 length:375 start_codon:yes stop_codon:yes gene_type:complete